jgi:HEAT repeat protein
MFLGLELSGTDASRDTLSDVLKDGHFRALDRARAASALSDIGTPTQGTAELLLAQGQNDGDPMVANVSLLGLGSMARRSDAELKTYVHASLEREFSAAGDESKARIVLDAMGNSGDLSFADELETQLGKDSAATRQHAAEALGRLDPAEAAPRLLDRLREETDPAVTTAIVGALHGPPTADAIALMSDKLAASTSVSERAAIIAWLGGAARTEPGARSLLVAQFHRETNTRLMQQIGTFVPAAALQ